MTELIACLGSERGTIAHVERLIEGEQWEKIFLLTNEMNKDNLKKENAELIVIDSNKFLKDMVEDIKNKLDGKISGVEVAVNFISGSGKEHMAMISALLKMGLGIRLVSLTKEGIKEI